MSVFIVKKIIDHEYGCRDIEAVFSTSKGAEEYIDSTGKQCEIEFWNKTKAMQYIIEKYEVQ